MSRIGIRRHVRESAEDIVVQELLPHAGLDGEVRAVRRLSAAVTARQRHPEARQPAAAAAAVDAAKHEHGDHRAALAERTADATDEAARIHPLPQRLVDILLRDAEWKGVAEVRKSFILYIIVNILN